MSVSFSIQELLNSLTLQEASQRAWLVLIRWLPYAPAISWTLTVLREDSSGLQLSRSILTVDESTNHYQIDMRSNVTIFHARSLVQWLKETIGTTHRYIVDSCGIADREAVIVASAIIFCDGQGAWSHCWNPYVSGRVTTFEWDAEALHKRLDQQLDSLMRSDGDPTTNVDG
jgi:hypothetical protein